VKLNLFLSALLVALVAANLGLSDNPTRRNWEAMPEMVRTASYKSFSPNPNFRDGKTLQLPPEGVVARSPVAAPRARSGAAVFQIYCQPCHGAGGKGDGPVAARGFPPPPSLLATHSVELTDDQMFDIVTRGQKNMPSYASQIPAADRRAAITYVRGLQGAPQP
jgi:mono/diheme cytochrome c family protein